MKRVILHVDMNNCYASIEIKRNPQWRGLPLAVCGSVENRHGIILAKSQEAKKLGVKTGEAIWQAQQKCPNLLLVPPHYEDYLYHSRLAREIYYEYTNQVEPFGLDECWLDVTASTHLFGDGEEIAETIRKRIKEELGITVSIGVSFNKIFAKLGSDMKKPDAITVIGEDFREKIWGLPADAMIGIGRKTIRKLNAIGIYTLGDLALCQEELLKDRFGVVGSRLWHAANGREDSPVSDLGDRPIVKSLGNSTTCTRDLVCDEEVFAVFRELAYKVSTRLRENGLEACGVEISLRDNQLYTRHFQAPLSTRTQSGIILSEEGMELFKKKYPWPRPLRSLGIRAIRLIPLGTGHQMDFFSDYQKILKQESLDTAVHELREKYGGDCVTFASLTGRVPIPDDKTDIVTLPNGLTR